MSADVDAATRAPSGGSDLRRAGPVTVVAVLAVRSIRVTLRRPVVLVFVSLQPLLLFGLFAGSMGELVPLPEATSYLDFLVPGAAVLAAMLASLSAGTGLIDDHESGLLDRLRSLPVPPAAVLAGRIAGDVVRVVANVMVVLLGALAVGYRPAGGLLGTFGLVAAASAFGILCVTATSWLALRTLARDSLVVVVQLASFVATFLSAAFVPVDTMPGWMPAIAGANPVTVAVEAGRGAAAGMPAAAEAWRLTAWVLSAGAVLGALALRCYRRLT